MREVGACIWILDREQGYHNKREAAISHGRTRKNTAYCTWSEVAEYIVETAVSKTTALMNVKVILQVAYMSAFRPSFCLNGSFARVFKIFSHRHTHGTDPAQARGNKRQAADMAIWRLTQHTLLVYT